MAYPPIAQLSISRASFPVQTIETGWHVLGSLYGDYSTRFFVFYATIGHASTGGGLGGYNAVQPGWVQTWVQTPLCTSVGG
jgi:hypothetical protein